MTDFTVRTAEQLPTLIRAFRKQSGMTQSDIAMRLGITQQSLSSVERNAAKVSADRLLEILNILGVELVLRNADELPSRKPPARPDW